MVSLEPISSEGLEPGRISFSSEFLDESNFISICPNPEAERERERERERARNAEFEFLSGNLTNMITADELFCEGKLLPFWQIHQAEKLTLNGGDRAGCEEIQLGSKEDSRISWFLDDDPSPRPPKCTVLWKELLKLRKQRPSTLSPSTSSSSSSSRGEPPSTDDQREKEVMRRSCKEKGDKSIKKMKKGSERSRSVSIRIRPVLNVPICTQVKNTALPPLFSTRKPRILNQVK